MLHKREMIIVFKANSEFAISLIRRLLLDLNRMTLHLGRTVLNAAPPPAQQVCIVNGRPLQYCWEMGVQFGCTTSYQGGMFKS